MLCCLLIAAPTRTAFGATAAQQYTAAIDGHVVKFGLSGFEPDFDPIDRVIISATLRHGQHAGVALPDSALVLSLYLENFQPDTTPVLPDLLHPNQDATNLGGFMQGKAALATGGNHVSYSGSMLGEVFLDNSVHLIVDLYRTGAPQSEPAIRLVGAFLLHKNLSLTGSLHSAHGLTPVQVTALRGAPGPVSWQAVERGLTVSVPPMMGTAGSGKRPTKADTRARKDVLGAISSTHRQPSSVAAPAQPGQRSAARQTHAAPFSLSTKALALIAAVVLALVALVLWVWPYLHVSRRATRPRDGTHDAERDHA